jgi:Mg2+ and Co2+ transporter CorA
MLTKKQTFSLIAQDENRIARRVAEESAQVSIAAKRDSAAMKSISLLTMVFLPPTFVAVGSHVLSVLWQS